MAWMLHRLAVVLAIATSACGAAAPLYFQGNAQRWQMPLVGPLENADLVVPVTIDGKGPYLFAIDPDTGASRIDMSVADALGLYRVNAYVRVTGADGHSRPLPVYEVQALQAGDLSLRNFQALGVPRGVLRFNGRAVAGILGSNIFTRTIVMDIDRDAGWLRLALTGHEAPPPMARPVDVRINYRTIFVPARIDGQPVELHLHLGSRFCTLWPRAAARLGVPFGHDIERIRQLTSEIPVLFGPRLIGVTVGDGLPPQKVRFTAHYDAVAVETRIEGVLGQNFLARFRLLVDRDDERVWLAPRDENLAQGTAARLARWGGAFAACARSGCVETVLVPPQGQASPRLLLRRQAGMTVDRFEAIVEPLDAAGRPLAAPLFRVSFPSGARDVSVDDPRFAGILAHAASYRVVDLSPFPVDCGERGCVDSFDRFPR